MSLCSSIQPFVTQPEWHMKLQIQCAQSSLKGCTANKILMVAIKTTMDKE